MNRPGVSLIGGYARAIRRHLERRGPQDRAALHDHFAGVNGAHEWYPEDVDRAVSELIEAGFAETDAVDGVVRLTARPL